MHTTRRSRKYRKEAYGHNKHRVRAADKKDPARWMRKWEVDDKGDTSFYPKDDFSGKENGFEGYSKNKKAMILRARRRIRLGAWLSDGVRRVVLPKSMQHLVNKGDDTLASKRQARLQRRAEDDYEGDETWQYEEDEEPSGPMKIKLDNMDHDDGLVLVMAENAEEAKMDQSIMGSNWEFDGDFAYALISDAIDLVQQLEADGYEVDDGDYDAPTQEDLDRWYQEYKDQGGR